MTNVGAVAMAIESFPPLRADAVYRNAQDSGTVCGSTSTPRFIFMSQDAKTSLFAEIDAKVSVITVKLVGPAIGQREAPIISDLVVPALNAAPAGFRWLVLDLSQITFMNSMALGMCIDFRNRANKAGGKTILYGMNDQMTALFKMVKVDRLYTLVKDAAQLAKVTAK
jgi:anti-anti-sigma factor